MIRTAEKNRKQRFSNLPTSIGWVLKIAFAVAGFALWGWSFVAVVAGIYAAWAIIRGVLSCLVSLLMLAIIITLIVGLIF